MVLTLRLSWSASETWDPIARDRDAFQRWLDTEIFGRPETAGGK